MKRERETYLNKLFDLQLYYQVMVNSTNFEKIMNFSRSYIVYHTYFLNNEIFLTLTRKNEDVMIINKKKIKLVNFFHSKCINLKL